MQNEEDQMIDLDVVVVRPNTGQMKTKLARELIKKQAIRVNTEVDARYNGIDLAGARLARPLATFMIKTAKIVSDNIVFEGVDVRDGSRQKFECEDIIMIDGMDPIRFASNFGLDPQGEHVAEGKRRGRKPKARLS